MESKYLYINGEYVHTNQELWEKIRELIDDSKSTNGDATIRLLSDLYGNGHLKEFCSQKEYVNGKENPNCIVTFDDNLRGDIKIANHVAARLKGDDNYAPFSHGIHKHFTIHSVSISRKEEQEVPIGSIPFTPKEKNESVFVFLLNGFRQHKNSIKDAFVNLTYSIDNKESLNEQIPVSIGSHSEILNLSKIKDEMEVSIKIKESDLDPCKDINILIGDDGCYGKIILKAPQITVNICQNKTIVPYQMMRIIYDCNKCFYIGVYPFEFKNNETCKKLSQDLKGNLLYDRYYSQRTIDFYVLPKDSSHRFKHDFFNQFKIQEGTEVYNANGGDCVLDVPNVEEWEYAALMKENNNNRGSIVCQKSDSETYDLSSKEFKQRFTPNRYGLYAMFGNIHEIAMDGYNQCFMGGNIRIKSDIDLEMINGLSPRNSVPFYCVRLVLHDKESITTYFGEEDDDLVDESSLNDEYVDRLRWW